MGLDGGGSVTSTDEGFTARSPSSVHPWEITLEPRSALAPSSARNRLAARVASVTELGSRARVGLDAGGQALAAEVTPAAIAGEPRSRPRGRRRLESFGHPVVER